MLNKKICLTVFTVIISLAAFAQDNFTNALKNCSSYSESGNAKMLDMDVISTKKILGWEGDKCVYNEDVTFMGIESNVACKFSKAQINEIVTVMNAYELVQQYSGESPDFSSLDTAQNNPIARIWSKYMQDPGVCSVNTKVPNETLQYN